MLLLLLPIILPLIKSEIIFVFEHFRHGARGPGFGLINPVEVRELTDMYGIVWDNNGELTDIGMRMEYILGVRNRYKYKKLLSELFDPKELLVFSTDMSRTVMSAQAQLQGMFPPFTGVGIKEREKTQAVPPNPITPAMEEEIKKLGENALPERVQIIPIHLFNQQEMNHILLKEAACPPLRTVKEELRNSEELIDFFNKLNKTYGKELMEYFHQNNSNFLYDYYNVFFMADVFLTDYDNFRDMSSLEKVGINLTKYYDLSVEMKSLFLFHAECNEEMGELAASPSFRKIVKWMELRIKKDISKKRTFSYGEPKFVMYSGHDMTLAPFQLFMKSLFGTRIQYTGFASNIYIELHKKDNLINNPTLDDYHVEYYIDDEIALNISFVDFKNAVLREAWSEERIMQYCQPPLEGRIILVVVVGLIVISFILFLTVSLLCFKRKKKKKGKKNLNKEVYLI